MHNKPHFFKFSKEEAASNKKMREEMALNGIIPPLATTPRNKEAALRRNAEILQRLQKESILKMKIEGGNPLDGAGQFDAQHASGMGGGQHFGGGTQFEEQYGMGTHLGAQVMAPQGNLLMGQFGQQQNPGMGGGQNLGGGINFREKYGGGHMRNPHGYPLAGQFAQQQAPGMGAGQHMGGGLQQEPPCPDHPDGRVGLEGCANPNCPAMAAARYSHRSGGNISSGLGGNMHSGGDLGGFR